MKYSLVNFCEFDKYAAKSYCAIHGTSETLNLGDITKVDEREIEPFNMICGGSPCQDFPWQASRQARFGNAEAAGMSITLCRYIIPKGTPAACVVPMILIKHVLPFWWSGSV